MQQKGGFLPPLIRLNTGSKYILMSKALFSGLGSSISLKPNNCWYNKRQSSSIIDFLHSQDSNLTSCLRETSVKPFDQN